MQRDYASWGRFPRARHEIVAMRRTEEWPALPAGRTALPFGNGRSYGDTCLNDGGILIDCRPVARILDLDPATGVLRAEAGALLGEIIAHALPHGWFLPVTPGTAQVTLGGAIANDVHGKNHHRAGCLGAHIRRFELLRSDGSRRVCTPHGEHAGWFAATVGGMGLTGIVTWAEIALKPVASAAIDQTTWRFHRLDDFFALADEAEAEHDYTVAWVDSLASGPALGRGLMIAGDHAPAEAGLAPETAARRLSVPFTPPVTLVNRAALMVFNAAYWRRPLGREGRARVGLGPFFHPLDGIGRWNRLYGPKGLVQHQSVIPHADARDAVADMLARAARAGGSFLTVLKRFGERASPGILSFPRPGVTLTLDFPFRGERTLALLDELDRTTLAAGGRVNPYKDGRMGPDTFEASFPQWREILAYRDRALSSGFWRRVTGET